MFIRRHKFNYCSTNKLYKTISGQYSKKCMTFRRHGKIFFFPWNAGKEIRKFEYLQLRSLGVAPSKGGNNGALSHFHTVIIKLMHDRSRWSTGLQILSRRRMLEMLNFCHLIFLAVSTQSPPWSWHEIISPNL